MSASLLSFLQPWLTGIPHLASSLDVWTMGGLEIEEWLNELSELSARSPSNFNAFHPGAFIIFQSSQSIQKQVIRTNYQFTVATTIEPADTYTDPNSNSQANLAPPLQYQTQIRPGPEPFCLIQVLRDHYPLLRQEEAHRANRSNMNDSESCQIVPSGYPKLEEQGTWLSTASGLSFPRPRVPLEIQEHIIQFLRGDIRISPEEINDTSDVASIDGDPDAAAISSCCLVCTAWVKSCQKALFAWITLRNSTRLDNLSHLFRSSRLSHMLHEIRRISIVYGEPYFKIGEALPRIAMINPPRLVRIDYCPQLRDPLPEFRFHRSLPAQLNSLHNIRILYLGSVLFMHLVELRRLLACFPGIQVAIMRVDFANRDTFDHIQNRPFYRASNSLLQRIISGNQLPHPDYFATVWLKPQTSLTNEQTSTKMLPVTPSMSPEVLELVVVLLKGLKYSFPADILEKAITWRWDHANYPAVGKAIHWEFGFVGYGRTTTLQAMLVFHAASTPSTFDLCHKLWDFQYDLSNLETIRIKILFHPHLIQSLDDFLKFQDDEEFFEEVWRVAERPQLLESWVDTDVRINDFPIRDFLDWEMRLGRRGKIVTGESDHKFLDRRLQAPTRTRSL
ncbi:hypothetical protein NLI96_g3448 [Meripilus lineatus]|uniref:Uncharacterized protein n=1 Tax=Meripilus lineatus TaxID=2056292 RepID=A0AAD5VBI4_9APHY|nr:hypothetical protein NLI96_g3448 [Physisporinus lineatus]